MNDKIVANELKKISKMLCADNTVGNNPYMTKRYSYDAGSQSKSINMSINITKIGTGKEEEIARYFSIVKKQLSTDIKELLKTTRMGQSPVESGFFAAADQQVVFFYMLDISGFDIPIRDVGKTLEKMGYERE